MQGQAKERSGLPDTFIQRFVGVWIEEGSDNIDAFVNALGKKEAANKHEQFREEWSLHGDEMQLRTSTPSNSAQSKFRLNEMFEDVTIYGEKAMTMYTDEDNKIVCRQLRQPNNVLQTRELQNDGKMELTMTIDSLQPITARVLFIRDSQDNTGSIGIHKGQVPFQNSVGQKPQPLELNEHGGQPKQEPVHSSIVDSLAGQWKEESNKNLEQFMKDLDVNFIKRAVGDHTKFKEAWVVNGDTICLKVSNPFKSIYSRFRLNEMIEEDTMDGKKAKTMYTEENGRLMCRQQRQPHNVIQCRVIRPDGKMLLTLSVEGEKRTTAEIIFVRSDKK